MVLFIAILGAIVNRIRGGWILSNGNRSFNAITFGGVFGSLTQDLWCGVLMAIAMFAGMSLGWGRYIGALGGWETCKLEEVEVIDWFIQKLKPFPKLWGFFGLTLRGIVAGSLIALVMQSFMPLIGGATMGIAYLITLKISGRKGWEHGEFLFGALLWGATAIGV